MTSMPRAIRPRSELFAGFLRARSDTGTHRNIDLLRLKVCENYALSLRFGVKYIYRTMPRMLTLWLDLGEVTVAEKKGKTCVDCIVWHCSCNC